MVFIVDPDARLALPVQRLVDAFGLTAAEARVALAASAGDGTPAIARGLGLSANTVKTHLRRVYAKTGVSRQAALVRLVAALELAP